MEAQVSDRRVRQKRFAGCSTRPLGFTVCSRSSPCLFIRSFNVKVQGLRTPSGRSAVRIRACSGAFVRPSVCVFNFARPCPRTPSLARFARSTGRVRGKRKPRPFGRGLLCRSVRSVVERLKVVGETGDDSVVFLNFGGSQDSPHTGLNLHHFTVGVSHHFHEHLRGINPAIASVALGRFHFTFSFVGSFVPLHPLL